MASKVETFGEKMAGLRKARGWTRYRLSQIVGITQEGLSKLERGGSQPAWLTIQLLALAFDVPVATFIDESVSLPARVEVKRAGRPKKETNPPERKKRERKK